MEKVDAQIAASIILSISRIRALFEGCGGVEEDLKAHALLVLDAVLNPSSNPRYDLKEGVRLLIHILGDARWKMSEFMAVMEAHEYLSKGLESVEREII